MKSLNFLESIELLQKNKIPNILPCEIIKSEKDLIKIKEFPCVLKLSSSLLHKTEKKGVYINLFNQDDLLKAYNNLQKLQVSEKIKGTIVLQKQISGLELIIGLKDDNVFSKVIMFGSGGIYTEIFTDVSFRILPINEKEASNMVFESKIGKILSGARKIKYPTNDLIKLILKISELAKKEDIKELDLNPVIINEKGLYIVDARVLL